MTTTDLPSAPVGRDLPRAKKKYATVRRARKPRRIHYGWGVAAYVGDPQGPRKVCYAHASGDSMNAREARRLANWLLEFADWAETKK